MDVGNQNLIDQITRSVTEVMDASLNDLIRDKIMEKIAPAVENIMDGYGVERKILDGIEKCIADYVKTDEFKREVIDAVKVHTSEEMSEWVYDAIREYMERVFEKINKD